MQNLVKLLLVVFTFKFSIAVAEHDLKMCIFAALATNAEIQKARADFAAYKEIEAQTFATLLPSVDVSVSRTTVNQERTDGSGLELDQNYVTESDNISLRQPVYRPKLLRDYEKVKKEILAERLSLANKEDKLKMKVSETYFNLLRAYEEEVLIEKKITLLNIQKEAATKSIEAGTGTITELAEINAANDKAVADRIRATQDVRIQLNELNFFTGDKIKKVKTLNGGSHDFKQFEKQPISYWESKAISDNFELQSKREKIAAARIALSSEKLTRYPIVDLNAQVARGSSESTFFVDSETKTSSLGLTFSMPLYRGGSISSRIRQAASMLDAEIEGLRFQEEDLRKKVQKAYYGMQESIKLSDALKSAIRSAMTELESNQKSASAGIRNQLDVLISQQKALGVERELVDSKLNTMAFWLTLNSLAGSLDKTTLEVLDNFFIH